MRLSTIDPAQATGTVKAIYEALRAKLGVVPNMVRGLASSPAALESYVSLNSALGAGALDAKMRERIALTVAEANGCEYCLSAHTLLGNATGLSEAELRAARQGRSADQRITEGLRFAQLLVETHGKVTTTDINRVKHAGYTDAEVAEIVANVALNIFTNYFNLAADTTNDFPVVKPEKRVA